jgi:outer membrane immunogenic protein
MRKALLATVAFLATAIGAHAADLPVLQPVPPYVPPAFKWTGIYIGGNFAGGWMQRSWNDSMHGMEFEGGATGFIASGGQIGGNYQIGNIVLGGELELDYISNGGAHHPGIFVPGIGHTLRVTSSSEWAATVAARFGYAFDRVFVYGKAGGGWVGTNRLTISNVTTGHSITTDNSAAGAWLLGAGAEWAFGAFVNTWTVKLEYNYLGLGSWSHTIPAGAPFLVGDTFTTNRDIQMVKIGFNFLFNGPISSRYY